MMDNTQACAEMIREYWAARGHQVEVRVIPVPIRFGNGAPAFGIRSDMKNGKPASLVYANGAPAEPASAQVLVIRREKIAKALRDSRTPWRAAGLAHLLGASADGVLAELREMEKAGEVEALNEAGSWRVVWRWKGSDT